MKRYFYWMLIAGLLSQVAIAEFWGGAINNNFCATCVTTQTYAHSAPLPNAQVDSFSQINQYINNNYVLPPSSGFMAQYGARTAPNYSQIFQPLQDPVAAPVPLGPVPTMQLSKCLYSLSCQAFRN